MKVKHLALMLLMLVFVGCMGAPAYAQSNDGEARTIMLGDAATCIQGEYVHIPIQLVFANDGGDYSKTVPVKFAGLHMRISKTWDPNGEMLIDKYGCTDDTGFFNFKVNTFNLDPGTYYYIVEYYGVPGKHGYSLRINTLTVNPLE